MTSELRTLLDALGRDPDELMSINYHDYAGRFGFDLVTVAQAPTVADKHGDGDCWFGTQALRTGVTGRGSAADVVGLRSLNCDLDVKPEGLPSMAAAEAVIDTLAGILGVEPAGVVMTGHGLQPHWAIERDNDSDWDGAKDPRYIRATALWRRWGRLVKAHAQSHGGDADSTFDLSRIARVPGTVNRKDPGAPVYTTLDLRNGAPVSIATLGEILDDEGVVETPQDIEQVSGAGGEVKSAAGDWDWADEPCRYVSSMVAGWTSEPIKGGRHPWLTSQATRLAAAHRYGCLTKDGHKDAASALAEAFRSALKTSPIRDETPDELTDAFKWGIARMEHASDEKVKGELGGHEHDVPVTEWHPPVTAEPGDWTTPTPLGAPAPPPFPVDALGPELAAYANALAQEYQCPVDLPGVSMLAALAAAVGKSRRVYIGGKWEESLTLYTAVALPPGESKSPAQTAVFKPLREAVEARREADAGAFKMRKNRRLVAEKRLEKAQRDSATQNAAGNWKATEADIDGAQVALDELPEVHETRMFVDDATPEALAPLMRDHGALAVVSSEGGIFATLAGRYNNGVANIDLVLKAHDGTDDAIVDRKGAPPIHVKQPMLTFALAVQPSVFRELGGKAEFRDRGLVARFLYSLPTSRVGTRDLRVGESGESGIFPGSEYFEYVLHRTYSENRASGVVPLKSILDSLSLYIFNNWQDELEGQRGPGGAHHPMAAWSNKLGAQTARVAALLELVRVGKAYSKYSEPSWDSDKSGPMVVQPDTMERAITLMRYFIGHALATFDLMAESDEDHAARKLRDWVVAGGRKTFTRREAHQAHRGTAVLATVEQIDAALATLVDAGWVRPAPAVKHTGPGRPPSPSFEVNPLASS